MEPGTRSVRAVFTAARVDGAAAPFDTIHARVTYPARAAGTETERLTGTIAADPDHGRMPVVLVAPGVNVSPDSYLWLARRLATSGIVAVTYSWVGELFAGERGITPGIDLGAVRPDTYGSAPSFSAAAPLLRALAELDGGPGPLAGALDLDRVVLAGHSAGGTVVLQSSTPRFVPGLVAVFTYGAHTMASTALGWDAGTVLPVPGAVPLLLVGGRDDGVIAASAVRYGEAAGERADPLRRTFELAAGGRGDTYLAVIDGAGHFVPVDPHDPTVARGFLEGAPGRPVAETRECFAGLVEDFLAAYVLADGAAAERLAARVSDPPPDLAVFERK